MLTAQQIIELLKLQPLAIEGGYFRETYRSSMTIPLSGLPVEYRESRSVSTAIYYLITPEDVSVLHRVRSDEVFHFYAGDAVEMLQLQPDGSGAIVVIGNNLAAGQVPQIVVPAGVWQGCRLSSGGRWALLGCTVAPGFDYADFEAGQRGELVAKYPKFTNLIVELTIM